jgi:uncharacterized RDD family membrane protein YckC
MAETPEEPQSPGRAREPMLARLVGAGTRSGARVAEATGLDVAIAEVAEDAVVRALESPAAERAIARALESQAVERSIVRTIDSDMVDRVWERLLASDEVQKLIERIAQAPEIRDAIAYQGVGLIDDIGAQIGRVARRFDAAVERVARAIFRRPQREGPALQAGVVTRGFALVLDALIVNGVLLATSAALAFVINALFDPQGDVGAAGILAGGFVWITASSLYLIAFWSLSGETPGMRFLDLRLQGPDGPRLGPRRAVKRLIGMVLSVLPFGLGLVPVLFNERRQAWGDRFAETEVRYLPPRRAAPWEAEAPETERVAPAPQAPKPV